MSAAIAQLHDRRSAAPRSVGALRRAVVNLAASGGATECQLQDIALTVSEALTNVATHAYADAFSGVVVVDAALNDDALEVVVADEGVGMPPPIESPRAGLGLAIMARAADGLQLSDATPGTRVRMTFAIG